MVGREGVRVFPLFTSAAIGYLEVETSYSHKDRKKKIFKKKICSHFTIHLNSVASSRFSLSKKFDRNGLTSVNAVSEKKRNVNSLCVWIVTFFTASSPSSNLWKKRMVNDDTWPVKALRMGGHACVGILCSIRIVLFLAAAQATYQKRNDEPRSWVRLGVFFFVHTSCVDASPSVTISHAAVT